MSKSEQAKEAAPAPTTTGPAKRPWSRKQEMLLAFLHEPDVDPDDPVSTTHPPTAPGTRGTLGTFTASGKHGFAGSPDTATGPVCGYNLKALTRPFCPECGQELKLTVGAANLRLGWLMAAVAPGFFSGIAAIFLLLPIVGRLFFGDGVLMPVPVMMDLFGWSSGIYAIMLAGKRRRIRFLNQPLARQRFTAIVIWFIHVAALGLFIFIGVVFF